MPTSRIEVAWAVPVNIEQLGAHLEAYTTLQPVFSKLRLCNRFGSGPKAAIPKLPIELVQHIERYILQDKQRELLPAWARDLRCWRSLCQPIEHLQDLDILEMYNDIQQEMEPDSSDYEECGCCYTRKTAETVSGHVRSFIADELSELAGERMYGRWRPEHDNRVQAWHKRVGRPTETSRGRFDELSRVLEKHFGLKVWISHGQESRTLDFMDENVACTTEAYLHLPQAASTERGFEHHYVDYDYDSRRRATEVGFAAPISMPVALSTQDAKRFTRALKALNIVSCSIQAAPGSLEEDEAATRNSGDKPKDPLMGAEVKPKLTIFVRNDDDEEW